MAFRISMMGAPDIHTILLCCLMYGIIQKCAFCGELRCYVDFIETLTCTYEADFGSDDDLYKLCATWSIDIDDDIFVHCILKESAKDGLLTTYGCHMNMESFSAGDTIHVNKTKTKDGQSEESTECKEFNLNEIFKPHLPFNLSVSHSDGYNFSWNTKYEIPEHYTLHGELEYELSYRKSEDSWENQRSAFTQVDMKTLLLVPSVFKGGTEYVSRVRAKPRRTSEYKGPWSEWSSPLVWRTEHDDELKGTFVLRSWLPTTVVGLVVLIALIFVYCHVPQRLWKKMSVLIPDPAPFFKPLYLGHHGDFKSWLGTSYTLTTMDLFDWGITLPDVMEVCSQHLSVHPTKEYPTEMDEDYKSNACQSRAQSQEQSRFLITCQGSIGTIEAQSYGHVSSDTAAEFEEATPHCPKLTAFNIEMNHGLEVEGYLEMDLENQAYDLDRDLSLADSPEQNKTFAQGSVLLDQSKEFGRRCSTEVAKDPLMSLLEPNMSVLDLLHRQPDSWDLMVAQSYPSRDEDSTTYSSVPYDSFYSNSGNGEESGYPTMNLDLDTIDSGFADSECGSPVECEFDKNVLAQAHSSLSFGSTVLDADEQQTRDYVKQWISANSISVD